MDQKIANAEKHEANAIALDELDAVSGGGDVKISVEDGVDLVSGMFSVAQLLVKFKNTGVCPYCTQKIAEPPLSKLMIANHLHDAHGANI